MKINDSTSLAAVTDQTEIVEGCRLVDLPVISDRRGNLTFVESSRQVPFDIRRVYYLYDVPGGEMRAGHAHRALQQLVIALSGSFDVLLDDGSTRRTVTLNRAHKGLLMSNSVWREISNFSSGSVCMVLASMEYDESDYIRDYDDFLASVGAGTRDEVRRITTEGLGQITQAE
jgi:dTDP-4-dehydrorhamnose 3,5-epimerase-like enzyme